MVILIPSKNKRYLLTSQFQPPMFSSITHPSTLCLSLNPEAFQSRLFYRRHNSLWYKAEWQGDPARPKAFNLTQVTYEQPEPSTWRWSTHRAQTHFEMQSRACAKKNVETLLHLATIHNGARCLKRLYCLLIVRYLQIFCELSHIWEFSKQHCMVSATQLWIDSYTFRSTDRPSSD